MDSKAHEIVKQQAQQKVLKKEVESIKKKMPTYIVGFIFFTFLALYLFEDRFYQFFGNSVDFFRGTIILLGIFCLIFISKNYFSIKKKEKEIKNLSNKLYDLMKLDTKPENE
ncbi:MAG: hypothetical protein V3V28_14075 [Polaribacter sp.]|uniref:hypothetical protein n=1 Tax=Polaribacter sp. TaxID=1920175 RepID=UPI002F350847